MSFNITVKRNRPSVTQGSATVYLNDVQLMTFHDTIELISEGISFHGEMIGGWASVKEDSEFVHGLLFHPYDHFYENSDKMKKALLSINPNRFDEANGIIFTLSEITDNVKEYFNGHGIEFHEVASGYYYTETIMTSAEFEQLNHIIRIKHIA